MELLEGYYKTKNNFYDILEVCMQHIIFCWVYLLCSNCLGCRGENNCHWCIWYISCDCAVWRFWYKKIYFETLSIPFVNFVPFSGEAFEEVKEKSGEERYNVKLTLSFVDTKFVELGIITENGKHCFTKGV